MPLAFTSSAIFFLYFFIKTRLIRSLTDRTLTENRVGVMTNCEPASHASRGCEPCEPTKIGKKFSQKTISLFSPVFLRGFQPVLTVLRESVRYFRFCLFPGLLRRESLGRG